MAIADRLGLIPHDSSETCHVKILIRHGGEAPPLWYPQGYNFEWELGAYSTHDGFYLHQMPLAYMMVFRQASLDPGPSDPKLSAHPTSEKKEEKEK